MPPRGGDYGWFANNLASAPGCAQAGQITAAWTFGGTWNPEGTSGPAIQKVSVGTEQASLAFTANVTVKGKPRLNLSDDTLAAYASGSGTDTLTFNLPQDAAIAVASIDLNGGAIIASEAGATLRPAQLALPLKIAGK